MITRLKSDKLIVGESLLPGYVYVDECGLITAVTSAELPYDVEYDYTGYYVAPGFIDMHTHGGAGHEFFGSAEDIVQAANFHLSHGTTSICPTISAAPLSVMKKSVVEVKKAMNDIALKSNIIGLHLEGPYLSAEQCGAQCPDFITPPIVEEYKQLIDESRDVIARWTYAPENDGRHLPPELIRLILKIKGTDHVALCTDSLALAGTDVTEGITLNVPFIIEDGVCKLKDRSAFAGSIATSDRLVRMMTREVGVDMSTAVKMITKVPAEILGLNKGTLEAGKDADIVVFDDEVNMREVFVCGNKCRC